jgi:hypothetical protein
MYCNGRAACGTVIIDCPVSFDISKQMPVCQKTIKEMLSEVCKAIGKKEFP